MTAISGESDAVSIQETEDDWPVISHKHWQVTARVNSKDSYIGV